MYSDSMSDCHVHVYMYMDSHTQVWDSQVYRGVLVAEKGFHCIHIIWLCSCVLYVCSKYTCTCIATQ